MNTVHGMATFAQNTNFLYRSYCPLCKRSDVSSVFSKSFSDPKLWHSIDAQYGKNTTQDEWKNTSFSIGHCASCDFYFTQYIQGDEFYEKISHRQTATGVLPEREKRMGTKHYARLAFECERISTLLNRVPNDINVLEFGAGFGHWLLMAKAFNYKASGIEIYEDRIAYAEKNGLTIYRSLDAVADKGFDFIFSNQVFEHLNDPLSLLKPLAQKLNDKGIIQIGVPESGHIQKVIKHYREGGDLDKLITPVGHINCFTNHALVKLGEFAGLKLVSPAYIRKRYIDAMIKNRDSKYAREILLAGYKQNNSCFLYFEKA